MEHPPNSFAQTPVARDRDQFLRELLRELSGALEDTVGLKEAEGFIALVGHRIGVLMNREYCQAFDTERLDVRQVAHVLVDLKERIEGDFTVESLTEEAMTLVNTACPFGAHIEGRQSLCMMTSSVFGRIAASNQGYARVVLEKTIARGDPGCRVVVHFRPGEDGHEFFG